MTQKIAMRRRLAEHGIPQPRFAAVRTLHEARAAPRTWSAFPAVLKPADSGGQRGVFRLDSRDDLDRAPARGADRVADARGDPRELPRRARAERARDRTRRRRRVAHALRPAAPAGDRLRRRLDPRLPDDPVRRRARGGGARRRWHAVAALGLRDGVAFPQLLATDDGVVVVEVAARVPGGQMADLARHAVGVDLVEVALRQALGERRPGRARAARGSSSRSRSAS